MKKKSAKQAVAPWEITESMFLSEDEVDGLLDYLREAERLASESDKNRAAVDRLIIEILLFSGLRNSELCQLTVGATEASHAQSLLQVVAKSNESRIVYLPRSLSRDIVNFVRGARCGLVPEGQEPDDPSLPLILNERGRPYDRTALYRRVVRILSAAGLGDRASVQLLRHTYGYLAYKRSNGNLLFVQEQLGHAHPMVTAVYAQFVKFSYSDLADVVGGSSTSPTKSSESQSSHQTQNRRAKA